LLNYPGGPKQLNQFINFSKIYNKMTFLSPQPTIINGVSFQVDGQFSNYNEEKMFAYYKLVKAYPIDFFG
jgi:hypothetical protein